MNLTPGQKRVIVEVLNVFETGSNEGNYADISIFHDGPGERRQITYGRSQTTEYGNLRDLLVRYVDSPHAEYGALLRPYLARIGHTPLVDDHHFLELLEMAGESDPVMRAEQDRFFEDFYFQPAFRWAVANGFKLPLSMLTIYDSFIHSGGILASIRSRFPEVPPVKGGDERAWVNQYVVARHGWLGNHRKVDLHKTTYRTLCLLRQCQSDNWELTKDIYVQGETIKGAA